MTTLASVVGLADLTSAVTLWRSQADTLPMSSHGELPHGVSGPVSLQAALPIWNTS